MHPQETRDNIGVIWITLEMPGIDLSLYGAETWALMFAKITSRALQDKGVLFECPPEIQRSPPDNLEPQVVAFGNKVLAKFWITNPTKGLPMDALLTVRTELEALDLFSHAVIAWLDLEKKGDCWRYWHPASLLGQFVPAQEWNKQLAVIIAQVQTLLKRMTDGHPLQAP